MMRSVLIAVALGLAGSPAFAQEAQDGGYTSVDWELLSSPTDPDHLAAAKSLVDFVLPTGSYEVVTKAKREIYLSNEMENFRDEYVTKSWRNLSQISGRSTADLDSLSMSARFRIMRIIDPDAMKRSMLTLNVLSKEIDERFAKAEPAYRVTLRDIYASRFSKSQLKELNRFFASSVGGKYAAESVRIFNHQQLDAVSTVVAMDSMERKTQISRKIQDLHENVKLAKPRSVNELSDAEIDELAFLLGVSKMQLLTKH